MRLPLTPPDWRLLVQQASAEGRFAQILDAGRAESERPDRYLHWDELRHRAHPPDLSPEEHWASLKMNRATRAQPITLPDASGSPFSFFLTQRMFELLHRIDLRCGGEVSVPSEVTTPSTRDRYYVSSLMEEALTSSQLEGAVVTRSEARDMLRSGRKPTDQHERMVLNNYLTMQKLGGLRETDLSPELIREIHRRISKGTLEKSGNEGRLRTDEDLVRVIDDETGEVMHTPPPAGQLPERLEKLCEFANEHDMTGFLHPVIRSMLLHFWLAYDHPFTDGNGRTARALFYWSMLRHGFWLFEFISISHVILKAPKKYYRSFLFTESDENDLNYFLIHQLQTVDRAIDVLHEYIARKKGELEELRAILSPALGLNHRQLAVLRHALKRADAVYTVASHRSAHGVVHQTARTDLDSLVARELLIKSKRGNANLYQPGPDLSARLRDLSEQAQPPAPLPPWERESPL